ncbi:MAG: protein-L-isoaspartate(D-aspartate) O-methyltransferase [Bacteroidia bacterium]|nr:protein-L-isoaspartate(D-aspartate) O-methyltransferase [Bacteroidia bacterium]
MTDTYKHKGMRRKLSESLKTKGIHNAAVLKAIDEIPRHLYLPAEFEGHAYDDKAFPIGEGQTISQPFTVAYQTQLLNIKPGDKVLEIGTGSGYQASVLHFIGAVVYSIERVESLLTKTAKLLKSLNVTVHTKVGDGTKGWTEAAPFDKIIVTAGAPSVPKTYITQLKIGGILVIPVGKSENIQKMVMITKTGADTFDTKVLDDFQFVPLIGENGWAGKKSD